MQNLIEIHQKTINDSVNQTINARDLWEYLGSKRDFSTWIKAKVVKGDFVEDVDYLLHKIVEQVPHQGGSRKREIIEYHITLNAAKHISMMENSEKGKEVRQYFIKVEEAWNTPEMIIARSLPALNIYTKGL